MRNFLDNGKTIGKYTITKHLSKGGSGLTYLACEMGKHHAVVIKEYYPYELDQGRNLFRDEDGFIQPTNEDLRNVLRKEIKSRAKREEDKNKLLHFDSSCQNNIPGSYRFTLLEEDEVSLGIATYAIIDTALGTTLSDWMEQNAQNDRVDKIIQMIISIANKVKEQMHERQYVHFDLRPENIFIEATTDERPVLLDFEYASKCETKSESEPESRLVDVSEYPYSQQYSCSELQKINEAKSLVELEVAKENVKAAGFSIDTYSIVAIMKKMMQNVTVPSYLEPSLTKFFEKGMSEYKERFQNINDLIESLEELLDTYHLCGYNPQTLKENSFLREKNRKIDPDLLCEVKAGNRKYDELTTAVEDILLAEGSRNHCLLVVAEGGSGKSFSLHNCAKKLCERDDIFPFFLPAMELETKSIFSFFGSAFAKNIKMTEKEYEISLTSFLSNITGTALFLVDGLDELSARKQAEICKTIDLLIRQARNCGSGFDVKFVLSTRNAKPIQETLRTKQCVLKELPRERFFKPDSVFGSRFPLPLTPLVIVLLEEITQKKMSEMGDYEFEKIHIESSFDLLKAYFECLYDRDRSSDKWRYSHLLPYIAYETRNRAVFSDTALTDLFDEKKNESFRVFLRQLGSLPNDCPENAEKKAVYFKEKALATGLIIRSDLSLYHFDHAEKRHFLSAAWMKQIVLNDPEKRNEIITDEIQKTYYLNQNGEQKKDLSEVKRYLHEAEYLFHLLFDPFLLEMKGLCHVEQQSYLQLIIELGLNLGYFLEGKESFELSKKLDVLLQLCKEYEKNERILVGRIFYFFMCIRIPLACFGSKKSKIQYLEKVAENLEDTHEKLRIYIDTLKDDRSKLERFQAYESQCLGNIGGTFLETGKLLAEDAPELAFHHYCEAERYNWKSIRMKQKANYSAYRNFTALGTIFFFKGQYHRKRCEKGSNSQKERDCYMEAICFHELSASSHDKGWSEGYRHVAYFNIAGCYRQLSIIADSKREKALYAKASLLYFEEAILELKVRKEIERSNLSILRDVEKLVVDANALFQEYPELFEERNEVVWKIVDDLWE